jgi:glycosyltransferase involved in cell wall biosynthesis
MELAIVIPAYKSQYLNETLLSISKQTDKDFIVYIGDDNSPHNLQEIISPFEDDIKIVYKKFSDNVGSTNLCLHWERCIEMAQNEDWIWLFSDDDLMDENCVSKFKATLRTTKSAFDLYRFNTKIINAEGGLIHNNILHPQIESADHFAIKRLELSKSSYAVEYIFSRQKYIESGKFVSFPMAWCSDDATWINMGFDKNIFTIPDAYVHWRYSFTNISSALIFDKEKIDASVQYLNWLSKWIVSHLNTDKALRNSYENAKLYWLKHQVKILNRRFGFIEIVKLSSMFKQRLSIPIITSLLLFIDVNYINLQFTIKNKLRIVYKKFK